LEKYMPDKICVAPGCARTDITAKDLCQTHYHRMNSTGSLELKSKVHVPEPCTIDGCEVARYGNNVCRHHYDRIRRGTLEAKPVAECSEAGCANEASRRGLCQNHYRQLMRREADPDVGSRKPGPAPKAVQEQPSKEMTSRGRTKAAPAKVVHTKMTPEELETRRLARNDAKTHCVNGHPLTPENTYTTDKGQKTCKICSRASNQRHFDRPVDTVTPVGLRNDLKTHCTRGHAYEEHGRKTQAGTRVCRLCAVMRHRKYAYNVTPEMFEAAIEEQNNTCAICADAFTTTRNTHTDHEHITGIFRGVLCGNCNTALGNFKDSPAVLRAAADYVEFHQARILELLSN
jgi:hypothetical protein